MKRGGKKTPSTRSKQNVPLPTPFPFFQKDKAQVEVTQYTPCIHACINQSIHYRTFDCCCVMDLFLRAQINNRLRPLNLFSNIIVNIGGVMTFPLHLKESRNAGNTSSTVIYLSMQIAVAVVVYCCTLITVLAFLFGVCIFFCMFARYIH